MASHYLKLAYLAETAIVFNLAYIELKWKQDVQSLTEKTRSLASLTSRGVVPNGICSKKGCDKCDDVSHMRNKFGRFTVEYLSDIQQTVCMNLSDVTEKKPLNDLWSHAECHDITKFVLKEFHLHASKGLDRKLSSFLLLLATIVLVILTIVDNDMDLFSALSVFGLWEHEANWSWFFSYALFASLFIPGILWCMWRKFLIEYECLGRLLVKSYQEISKNTISGSLDDFKS